MCVLLYVNLWGQWLSVSLALGSLQNSESLSVFMCAPHPKQEQTCWKWFLSIITHQVYLIWQLFSPLSTFYDVPWISFVAEGTGPDSEACVWMVLLVLFSFHWSYNLTEHHSCFLSLVLERKASCLGCCLPRWAGTVSQAKRAVVPIAECWATWNGSWLQEH